MSSTIVPDAAADGNANLSKTPAQLMQEQHEAACTHKVTVEDVVDEEDIEHPPPSAPAKTEQSAPITSNGMMSAKAAGKQKASEMVGAIDTQDEEAFPSLGSGPKAPAAPRGGGWAAAAGKAPINAPSSRPSSGAQTPSSGPGARTPTNNASGRAEVSLPGRTTDQFEIENSELNKSKPRQKVFDDTFRKYNVKITTKTTGMGKKTTFIASGPKARVTEALMYVSRELTIDKVSTLEIPASVSARIIGAGGSNILKLQDKFGVKIKIDRNKRKTSGQGDVGIDTVEITGHSAQVAQAYDEIAKLAREHQPKVDVPLRSIPPEFYPFIAGRHGSGVQNLEKTHNVNIKVPQYHTWSSRAPSKAEVDNKPARFAPHGDSHIVVSGESVAVSQAREALERLAEQLQAELMLEELQAQQFLHPFIVGDRGLDPLKFLEQTGCSVIIPPGHHETEEIHIIGPQDKLDAGRNYAEELMAQKHNQPVHLHKHFADSPAGPERHSRALAQYLRKRAIEREFANNHSAEIIFPSNVSASPSWTVITDDPRKALTARNELSKITQAYPTPRLQLVEIDPFFHPHLEQMHAQKLQEDFGVHLIVPDGEDSVVLVYEGPRPSSPFQISRDKPSKSEISEFERALKQAEDLLRGSVPHKGISKRDVEVPGKLQEKVRRYVNNERQSQTSGGFPVQVDFIRQQQANARDASSRVYLSHPEEAALEELQHKIEQFLIQAEQDEKERGYKTTMKFPSKYNANLVGKSGAHVKSLREKHDVDIQVGKNEGDDLVIQGPQKKAEACKAEIAKLLKTWEDEVNYVIKIESKYHGQLVGRGGENLRKLQYKTNGEVRIDFPRASRAVADDASDAGEVAAGRSAQAPDEIRIRGPKAKADLVKNELLELKQYFEDNSHTATVSVAQDQVGALIGSRGAELDRLRNETGATIDIPKENGSSRVTITLRGTKQGVAAAKAEISQRSKAFDAIVSKNIEVDNKHHSSLIGRGGETIQSIVKKAGSDAKSSDHVRVPRAGSNSNTITVKGTQDIVDAITKQIEEFVRARENSVEEIVDVPAKLHRNLIGPGGKNKAQLQEKFGVILNIPPQGKGTGVTINGEPENVNKMKEHLSTLIDTEKGESITVPRRVHHAVAQNGATFNELNKMGIRVDHGGQRVPPKPKSEAPKSNGDLPLITDSNEATPAPLWDIISLSNSDETGDIPWNLSKTQQASADAMDKAKARIESLLKTAEEPQFTGYLTLHDPKLHRRVIGQGGEKIDGMRNATGCDIQVPRRDGKGGEAITIIGSEEGVLKAKEMILEAVGGNN